MLHAFARYFGSGSWLLNPASLRAMILQAQAATPAQLDAAMQAAGLLAQRQALTVVGDVAVIDMFGPISYRPTWESLFFGGSAIVDLQTQFRQALAEPAVKSIVFRVDTPGGNVEMVPEFADELYAARGQKPIIAVADTMIASAGYWLAAQADRIYATASSQLGSIGVYLAHQDLSELLAREGVKITLISYGDHKVDGNPFTPLSEDVRANLQAEVTAVGQEFEAAVARGRGVSKKTVAETFGQGALLGGRQAIAAGLADKLSTFGQVLSRKRLASTTQPAMQSAADPLAADPPVERPVEPTGLNAADLDAVHIALVLANG